MPRSSRASARTKTLKSLNDIKKTLDNVRGWWKVAGTVYIPQDLREPGDSTYHRDRRSEEYPESQRLYWNATVTGIDKMIQDLQELREHCVTQYWETPEN